uniref:Uncharacterized protein n=1 Tax=Arundo donax TaxID=35708 RepID=A0A0A8ZTM0_ARUDO
MACKKMIFVVRVKCERSRL